MNPDEQEQWDHVTKMMEDAGEPPHDSTADDTGADE
jgi:hypothetical protein